MELNTHIEGWKGLHLRDDSADGKLVSVLWRRIALTLLGFIGGMLTVIVTFALSDRATQVGRIDGLERVVSRLDTKLESVASKSDVAELKGLLENTKSNGKRNYEP